MKQYKRITFFRYQKEGMGSRTFRGFVRTTGLTEDAHRTEVASFLQKRGFINPTISKEHVLDFQSQEK